MGDCGLLLSGVKGGPGPESVGTGFHGHEEPLGAELVAGKPAPLWTSGGWQDAKSTLKPQEDVSSGRTATSCLLHFPSCPAVS